MQDASNMQNASATLVSKGPQMCKKDSQNHYDCQLGTVFWVQQLAYVSTIQLSFPFPLILSDALSCRAKDKDSLLNSTVLVCPPSLESFSYRLTSCSECSLSSCVCQLDNYRVVRRVYELTHKAAIPETPDPTMATLIVACDAEEGNGQGFWTS